MFGLSHETFLLWDALIAIIGLILLITKFRVHPFIALTAGPGRHSKPSASAPATPSAMSG